MSVPGYVGYVYVAGEVPGVNIWNQLWGNDSAFNTFLTGPGTAPSTILTNPYKFSASITSPFNATSNPITVQFNAKNFDTGNNFSTSTYKFTAPVAGFYSLSASVAGNQNAGIFYAINIIQNSSTAIEGSGSIASSSNTNPTTVNVASGLVQANAGDYFYVQWTGQASTGNYTITGGTFSGFLVSAS